MTPRLVIDTNVLLDFWVFEDARALPLWQLLLEGSVQALRSEETDGELAEVLARPQFAVAAQQQEALIARWRDLVARVERIFPAPWQCTDPRDQKFLDLAHTARAAGLITKDKALLKLNRRATRGGLVITTPAHWLAGPERAGA